MALYKTLTFATEASPETHSLHVLLNAFTQLTDARKSRFASNTPDPLCAKGTGHLIRFARNDSIKKSPYP